MLLIRLVDQNQPPKVFFSVAEASGDRHAGGVIRCLLNGDSRVVCMGLGGPAMAEAGCNLLENTVDRSAMLLHVVGNVRSYLRRLMRVRAFLAQQRPDVVVVVDSFAWNIHVARAARKLGIPVVYYVAPQLWAWAPWRIGKLRKTASRVACILPFEQEWFRRRGVDTAYVGHPLFDHPNAPQSSEPATNSSQTPQRPTEAFFANNNKIEKGPNGPTIALLPGSRGHEMDKLWEPMQTIARKIQKTYPEARFLSTVANPETAEALREQSDPRLGIEIRSTSIGAITRQADLTLVASGTATLEVAAQNCPMVVMYHVHPLQWHLLGRWLITTPYLCLVNILARKELVPEFMPFYRDTEAVTQTVLELLGDDQKRGEMRQALGELMRTLIRPGAAQAVAQIIRSHLFEF